MKTEGAEKKDIQKMSKGDFKRLPHKNLEEVGDFDALIVLPTDYACGEGEFQVRCMEFVVCKDGVPLCRVSGRSTALHLDGIGGDGEGWIETGKFPELVPPSGWIVDCLPGSSLIRLQAEGSLRTGKDVPDFCVYSW